MQQWGWVNFLKEIAKSKVFDNPAIGNSIECVKKAKLYDVLVYASEEKEYQEAAALDYEREMKRMKS